nr:Gfo/Idh/MocA family oxidoreductase [Limihaloglobus sulfuriphilus]
MNKVRYIVVGAGQRGRGYAQFILNNPDKAELVGVAEPRDFYRRKLGDEHNIARDNLCTDWQHLAQREKFADAVIIATQDQMHRAPAEAFTSKGYHILLEKPMAVNEQDCRAIIHAIKKNKVIFAVGHVLRYTPYTIKFKQILDSGRIGEIVSIQHLEPVGYWHQAHSYVRGNWCKETDSTFMLMSKSCHDIDWIRYIAGSKCRKVSSFGNLKHFRKENKPAKAAGRCLDCEIEKQCPYSAVKNYIGMFKAGHTIWPVSYITSDVTLDGLKKALREGPYGVCVYDCNNDVVDHQVVNLLFENGVTASFTMTAFTKFDHRKTRIFGTKGQIEGNGSKIEVYDFVTDQTEVINTDASSNGIVGGHGGGDQGLMERFTAAVQKNDRTLVLSGPDETLESHRIVFAAEMSRIEDKVIIFE